MMSVDEDILKEYGEGSIFLLGDDKSLDVEFISSGSPALDAILGGGFPRGRVTELYGNEGGGKTTISLHLIAEAQKQGLRCMFIDVEHALDPTYAAAIGVDVDSLVISQPPDAETAMGIADKVSASGEYGVVVIDSVAALVTRAELEGGMGDAHVGLNARLMSQSLRKMTGTTSKAGTALVFINQIREKIGVMFGNPETTPGGRALKFYATVRLSVNRVGKPLMDGDLPVGGTMRVKTQKNKVFPPFRTVDLEVEYGKGIDTVGEWLDSGVESGFFEKKGAHYFVKETGEKLGVGRQSAKNTLKDSDILVECMKFNSV